MLRWRRQTLYSKGGVEVKRELEQLKINIDEGHIPSHNGQLQRFIGSWKELEGRIEEWAKQVGVVLTLRPNPSLLSIEELAFFMGG